eukprot:933019-Pleurochrysis_carterae.AAC.1
MRAFASSSWARSLTGERMCSGDVSTSRVETNVRVRMRAHGAFGRLRERTSVRARTPGSMRGRACA